MSNTRNISTRTLALLAAAALLLVATVFAGLKASEADGVAAKVIGQTKKTPDPFCPKDCLITGTVTGFQVTADGKKGLFKVPSDGHIVAWSVDLGKPNEAAIGDANDLFDDKKYGGKSVGRLAVLKPEKKAKYKLTKQTPVQKLEPRFGRKPIFTLNKPMRVKKGQRLALTMPTWAPVFRSGLSKPDNQWIVSRSKDDCGQKNLLDAKPHQKKGSVRSYGCRFNGERILYWAYFVPNK
jgi:hypothetical protein